MEDFDYYEGSIYDVTHDQDLVDAIQRGDSRLVGSRILSRQININARIHDSKTALCLAASYGQTEVVRTLLELNADPSISCKGLTAMHYACKNSYEGVVALLCRYAPCLADKKGEYGDTPLHMACDVRDDFCVRSLCESGAFLYERNKRGNTAFHVLFGNEGEYVSEYGIERSAKILLQFGFKIDAKGDNGMTALHFACMRGFCESVKFLLNNGAAINAKDIDGRTPLHKAVEFGHKTVVCFLLDNGAAICSVDEQKTSVLHVAAEKGNMEITRALVDKEASLTHQDSKGRTPLFRAVQCDQVLVARYLLESGSPANLFDEKKVSPLLAAVKKGRMELIDALLSAGAAVNQQDDDGRSPLIEAVTSNNVSVACHLLDCGADPNLFDKNKFFPLLAADKGCLQLIRALVTKGASINQQDDHGRNALNLAVFFKHEPVVHYLLENGADPNLMFDKRLSPLHYAAESGEIAIIRALVSKGASVNKPNDDGLTPLHIAAFYGHETAVGFLLENGATLSTPDEYKDFPIHTAARKGHLSVVQALVRGGASVNEKNGSGRTPLHIASQCNHIGVVRFLLENGASVNILEEFQKSPLHMVCEADGCDCEIIEVLVKYGCEVNSFDKHHGTALKWAITDYQLVDAVRVLTNYGADVRNINSEESEDSSNALCTAAYENAPEIVKFLGDMFSSQEKEEAVLSAASNGSLESLKALVAMGANADFADSDGQTAVHYSSACDSWVECVKFLLSVGAEVDKVDNKGRTPLLVAAAAGAAEVARMLLEAGANAHAYDLEGGCSLTHACAGKHSSVVRVLLDYEAGVEVMCPHNDMNLLRCLYLQNIDDIMMVDAFEKAIIRMCAADLSKEWVHEGCLVEEFPDTCDWNLTTKFRRLIYRRECQDELMEITDLSPYFKERFSFPGTKITYLQALRQDPAAFSHPELQAFLQPKHKLWGKLEKDYPIYGRLIRIRLQIALERESLVDGSLEFFDRLGLTVYPARMICDHLTNYDLRTISSLVKNLSKIPDEEQKV